MDGESATVGKRLSVKCLKPLDGTSFPGPLSSSFSSFTVCSTIFSCCLAHPSYLAFGWEFEWIHQQLHSTCSSSSLCQRRSPLQPPQPPRREAPTLLSWRWHRKHTTPQPWANHLKSQSWGPSSAGPANPGAGPERIVSPVQLVTISLIREESETSRADKRRLLSSAFWNVLKNYCSFSIFNSLLHPALP